MIHFPEWSGSVQFKLLDETDIAAAVEVSNRAYKLLVWLNRAIESGFITLDSAGRYIGNSAAAQAWLAKHFEDIPHDARPLDRRGRELERFANYFASYLTASFDLHEVTGTRFVTGPEGYCCERCGYRVPKSHLQPKKLERRDKDRACELVAAYVEDLAREQGVSDSRRATESVLNKEELQRDSALATYGAELLRRLDGKSSGAAALALWRQFAWNSMGSPIKKFRLDSEMIMKSQHRLVEGLRGAAA